MVPAHLLGVLDHVYNCILVHPRSGIQSCRGNYSLVRGECGLGNICPRCVRVPAGERVIHRVLGVCVFGRVLDGSGWNRRVLKPLRGFSGKKTGLLHLEKGVQTSAVSHGICFGIHVVLAVVGLFSRHPWRGAIWMLLPAVPIHLYPVLLQRSIMLRLQPLLDKTGSS
jgi:hypothetical protein